MATNEKSLKGAIYRSATSGQFITVGDVDREYGTITEQVNPKMAYKTYLRKRGLNSLADAVAIIDKRLKKA